MEWIEIGPSPIHGLGCFARCGIPKGIRVIEYVGERIDKRESLRRCEADNPYIFSLTQEEDLDGNFEWNRARLLNHSCAPNCEAELVDGRIWLTTIREVVLGEELTFNYGFDLEAYRDYPCQCGSPGCVGFIIAEEFFPQIRRNQESIGKEQ